MKKILSCLICNSKNFRFLYLSRDRMFDLPGLFIIKQCQKCKFVFIDPKPTSKDLKKHYPSGQYYSYSEHEKKNFFETLRDYLINHYYNKTILTRIITSVIPNVPAIPNLNTEGKILDIGCGNGDTMLILKGLGWDAYGFDIDKRAIDAARKRGLSNVRVGSYHTLAKYPDNFFDAVRLYHVIEHLDNPELCLKLISKKLKKNGELIIGTPNIDSATSFIFGKYWYNLDTPRHLFLFSPKTLRYLMSQQSFRSISIEYVSAGGIIGSCQYIIEDIFKKKIDLIHKQWLVIMLYPIERALDLLRLGDVFVLRARKE